MSVEELCEQNQEHRYEIVVIWNKCEHEWQYDTACGVYERNCYFCKHCKLWRNHYMYQ
jgi:hypothetical protein